MITLNPESVTILEQDNYYKGFPQLSYDERVKLNFDHPDSMDTPLLVEHGRSLRAGEAINSPSYDFAKFQRRKETVRLAPRAAIIVEGILILKVKLYET